MKIKNPKFKLEKEMESLNLKCHICNKQACGFVDTKPVCHEHYYLKKHKHKYLLKGMPKENRILIREKGGIKS